MLAIQGGAGTIGRARMTPRREARYRGARTDALRAGYEVLDDGGSSVDAVIAAVVVLEDSPLFNAGRGAVFNAAGAHELDAAVMDGATGKAGAVTGVKRAQNPVLVARAVLEQTPHVLLAGTAADRLARAAGLPMVAPDYFSTPERARALARARGGYRSRSSRYRGRGGARPLRQSCGCDLNRRLYQQAGR